MRKIFCLVILCASVILFCGCSSAMENLVLENMSDLRTTYFEGENEIFWANLCCGKREQIFAYDGVSTNKVSCGVLSVHLKTANSYSAIAVVLNIDSKTAEYQLERSPFEDMFMVDLEMLVEKESSVSVALKNSTDFCTLNCLSKDWNVDYKSAVQMAVSYFKDDLKNLYFNGKLNAECYLKVVSKPDYDEKYWYFSYVDRAQKSKSALIDVNSKRIIANK